MEKTGPSVETCPPAETRASDTSWLGSSPAFLILYKAKTFGGASNKPRDKGGRGWCNGFERFERSCSSQTLFTRKKQSVDQSHPVSSDADVVSGCHPIVDVHKLELDVDQFG